MTSHRIIIIGAGISGLVTGILLREAGHHVEIFERRERAEPIGGGIGIWPNGSEVLLSLPCANKIRALCATITHDVFADTEGNTLAAMPRKLFQQMNEFPILNVCRSDLYEILLREFGVQHIHLGVKCLDVYSKDSYAIAQMENGEVHRADLIIAADGIYSSIRKKMFPESVLHYAGYIQLLGVLRGLEKTKHHFIWGKNRYSIIFPISKDRHVFYQVCPYPHGKLRTHLTRQSQIDLFRGWAKEVDTLLDIYEQSLQDSELSQQFFCDQAYFSPPLTKWYDHRIALVGDAAHPMGSIFGLAACVALEDAYTLSSCLANYVNIETALRTYERYQQPRANNFFKLEQEITEFLLRADEKRYNEFLAEIKLSTPEIFNQHIISLLQGTYKHGQSARREKILES